MEIGIYTFAELQEDPLDGHMISPEQRMLDRQTGAADARDPGTHFEDVVHARHAAHLDQHRREPDEPAQQVQAYGQAMQLQAGMAVDADIWVDRPAFNAAIGNPGRVTGNADVFEATTADAGACASICANSASLRSWRASSFGATGN